MNAPRCGKPMTRYEASNGPMPEEPACGRPEGHPGPCRSTIAMARIARYESERWADRGSRRRQVRRRTLRLHEGLSAAIAEAEQVARARALGIAPVRTAA